MVQRTSCVENVESKAVVLVGPSKKQEIILHQKKLKFQAVTPFSHPYVVVNVGTTIYILLAIQASAVQLVEIGICEKWHRAQCCIFNTVKGSISKGVRLKYRTKNNITYSKQTVCQAIHMGISRINLFFRIKKVTLMMMLLPDMERIKSFGT